MTEKQDEVTHVAVRIGDLADILEVRCLYDNSDGLYGYFCPACGGPNELYPTREGVIHDDDCWLNNSLR